MLQRKRKTTDDLMIIKKDIQAIKGKLATSATKDDLKSLAAETKKGFAEVMWELKTIREENIVLSDMKRQINEHEDRLETVESKLRIAT
ncbi:MAG: hypothetical protein U1C50_04080 [Patescibacteria group bacterium]|nr:hypothetical protein [Candidatus Beckwithbacteria bacterium]MDZ4229400.1 hypothetical protein [Patescibacteria group bacterium]